MPAIKDTALVLRLLEHGNSSLVAVLLGRRLGQIRVLAKGVQRYAKQGFAGGLDLLARGEVVVYPRGGEQLWIFKEWDEQARPALGQSMPMLESASYLCELAEALTRQTAGAHVEDSPDGAIPRLHDLLARAADALSAGTTPGLAVLVFTLRALEVEGLLPPLDACGQCHCTLDGQSKEPVWLGHDGVVCRACRERIAPNTPGADRGLWLSPAAQRALSQLKGGTRLSRLTAPVAEQLARVMVFLVHNALEHDLRTLVGAVRCVRAMGR